MTGTIAHHDTLALALESYDAWDATDGAVNLRVRLTTLNDAARDCGYIGHSELVDWARDRVNAYKGIWN